MSTTTRLPLFTVDVYCFGSCHRVDMFLHTGCEGMSLIPVPRRFSSFYRGGQSQLFVAADRTIPKIRIRTRQAASLAGKRLVRVGKCMLGVFLRIY